MDRIIQSVKYALEKEQDVIALFLFGSRAAGNEKKGSDYDFFLVLDRNTKDTLREDEISRRVLDKTKQFDAIVHLTFQYLYIVNEDKSLLFKNKHRRKIDFQQGCAFRLF